MRGGPGLGNIAPSQADYFQLVKGGGHGDYHPLVLAPASVQEAVDLTYESFDLAEKYRGIVILAIDGKPLAQEDLIRTINRSADRPITLLIRRDEQQMSLTLTPRLDTARGVGRLGFSLEPVLNRLGPLAAVAWGVKRARRSRSARGDTGGFGG
jgi:pyruvate/2-oxoacid:ferredoxin oxidoreductase alpha subunit